MDGIVKDWFVSSHTAANNSCVEVRYHESGAVDVRNSNNRDAGTTTFTKEAWEALVSAVREGEFDLV